MMLPDGFDWRTYEAMIRENDRSMWAAQFMVRDPAWNPYAEGYSGGCTTGDNFHTMWRNGILCFGMKGHATSEFLLNTLESFKEHCPEEKAVVRDAGGGNFSSIEKHEKYRKASGALFGTTLEIAINLKMPREVLKAEFERLLDQNQSGFIHQEFKEEKGCTPEQWARGLAIFDLLAASIKRVDIERQLVPLWVGHDGNLEDAYKKAYNSVKPFINGGWRALCGDPLGFLDAPKVLPKRKEK